MRLATSWKVSISTGAVVPERPGASCPASVPTRTKRASWRAAAIAARELLAPDVVHDHVDAVGGGLRELLGEGFRASDQGRVVTQLRDEASCLLL
ncbi:hypothetical protein [Actinomadura madurae]|uniref:hypothetical protein n=1 Tax=Actinomadura madurae TaxID=1993 RepID=UPI0020D1FB4D|nr:hypothetical protein [Actinomadura madurae]MCQ0007172.1 hypothetical protein [Actinomadura madurae]